MEWDHRSIGLVHSILVERKWAMSKYVRHAKANGLPVLADGYLEDLERLEKICEELEDKLMGGETNS